MKNSVKKSAVVEVVEVKSFKGIRTGRKVNPNSARQIRLAEAKAKAESGVEIKRGRPVVTDSERQKRIAELEAKRVDGQIKRGRETNPNSARQLRLKDLETRRANGTLTLGRPKKQTDEISLIDMLKAKA